MEVVWGQCLVTLALAVNEILKWLSSPPILMPDDSRGDSVAIGINNLPLPPPPAHPLTLFSPSLISLMASVDVKHHVYITYLRP